MDTNKTLGGFSVEYLENDCGYACTPDGCRGHTSDLPVSFEVEGITFHVEGADSGDYPSTKEECHHLKRVVEAIGEAIDSYGKSGNGLHQESMARQVWNTGKPPNATWVKVEDKGAVIVVRALHGSDGTSPHWKSLDGNISWEPSTFTRWAECSPMEVFEYDNGVKVGEVVEASTLLTAGQVVENFIGQRVIAQKGDRLVVKGPSGNGLYPISVEMEASPGILFAVSRRDIVTVNV